MYNYVNDVAALNKVDITLQRSQRQWWIPSQLSNCIVMESTGTRSIVTNDEDHKVTLYFPILIKEFNNRFENKNLELIKAIQSCHPESPHFLEINYLAPLVTLYWCCTDCHFLEVYRYPIILNYRQPIFQSDTDYYKYTIKLTKL